MKPYILGLDLGSASIGWAIVEPKARVVDCGVRIFDPGVNLDDFTKGRDGSSNNVVRRTARLQRRQLRRRAARQRDLFRLLQQHGLLPSSVQESSAARHETLQVLDNELRGRWRERLHQVNIPEQLLVYLLRKCALDQRLEADELGRVLYQLGQRRGFKSSRRDEAKESAKAANETKHSKKDKSDEEDLGKVTAGIGKLSDAMHQQGARTLGEYLLANSGSGQRIRGPEHWTDRKMFLAEFDAIWAAQAAFHPALTAELKQNVHRLLFFQRPIPRNEHLIGKCELEPGERRAPMSSLLAQRFRIVQKINDLEYGGAIYTRPLMPEQRARLLEKLDSVADLSFDKIREFLALDKDLRFNLARGGEKKLPGNRTQAAMMRAIPQLWPQLPRADQDAIVTVWHQEQNDDEQLVSRLQAECALAEDDARAICTVHPEDRYANLSAKAMSRLLPLMETGVRFKTAEDRIYGQAFSGGKVLEKLPPAVAALPHIPNPAVVRALSELRQVANALVRKHGKPGEIRIELARELKRNAEQRKRDWDNMRSRESQRNVALKRILEEAHRPQPSGKDIERVLLFQESGGICPYCGGPINFQRLFDGDIDVDHILPRSMFPDNSFGNKLLAHTACNRERKRGRTPFEAFGADQEEWEKILARVAKWKNVDKLQRFRITDEKEFDPDAEDTFAARRLNDTRYVSKLAARYLGCLYGGRDLRQADGSSKRVIFCSSGMLTALLRREWKLESILEEAEPAASSRKPGKPRTDHRHHALDAIVIALSSNAMIGRVSAAAAARGFDSARATTTSIQSPWPNFVDSIRPHIEGMVVSHRPTHKLNGPLHEETNYSRPRDVVTAGIGRKKPVKKTVAHIRKPVHLLTAKQIADIVDPRVREAVETKLEQAGGDPKKLETECPMLVTRTGKQVPIRRVRVRTSTTVTRIAGGVRERYVALAGNHHVAIFETRGKKGEPQWESPGVVSRFEAIQRKSGGAEVIEKKLPGAAARFLFTLMSGDIVEMEDEKLARRNLFVVRTVSDFEITFVRHTEARKLADLAKQRGADTSADLIRALSIDKLRQWNCRKVFVDVLGKVHG